MMLLLSYNLNKTRRWNIYFVELNFEVDWKKCETSTISKNFLKWFFWIEMILSVIFNQYQRFLWLLINIYGIYYGIISTIPRGLQIANLNNNDMNNSSDIKKVWCTFSCNFFSIDSRMHVC